MRFTLIGHACMFIEAGGLEILVDPWLSGSCYWRSWWHYPRNMEIRPEFLSPDYIYISHHHFDHFHFPSMRRLDRRAKVLIPKFGVDVMPAEVKNLGFQEVIEIPHGHKLRLAGGVDVGSFQYGCDDSAFVVAHDGVVLADLNDCKIRGRVSDQLVRSFGRPTFAFMSHSWAQAYPICYTTKHADEAGLLGRADYAESFISTMRELGPQYAVPFASMVGFLHPETMRCNAHAVTPPEVAAAFAESGVQGTEVVVMCPGDSWDSARGFSIAQQDPYANREEALMRMSAEVAPQIAEESARESARPLTFEAFSRYFSGLLDALPPFAHFLFERTVVFHVASSEQPHWVVDLRRKRVYRAASPPEDWAMIIRIPDAVLADAIEKRILYFVHISLRISIELNRGGIETDFPFWALVLLYELGYLPLGKVLRPRTAGVCWRRRHEFTQLAWSLVGRRPLTEKLVGNLMTTKPSSNSPA